MIALIEPSPTLRFGLNRLLQQHQFKVKSFHHYQAWEEYLTLHSDFSSDLIVAGWPSRSTFDQHRLLETLTSPNLAQTPVLIFARHMNEPNLDGLSERAQTVIQLWQDFRDCIQTIEQLIEFNRAKVRKQIKQERRQPLSVLLVDDSKSVRLIYGKQLEKMQFQVTTASDAEEAWQIAQNNEFDLAIIDYFMPGENGAMLCQKLSESEPHRHILKAVLTGTYKEEIIQDCIDSGAQECMFKNESMMLFKTRIESMAQQVMTNRSVSQQKRYLESILQSVGEGIYGVDKEGKITFINPAALQILNYPVLESVLGQYAHQLFHQADEYGRHISEETNYLYQAYLLSDTLNDWETVFWTSDHQPIPIECTIKPLFQMETHHGSVVVFKNISERKLIEDELNWQLNHDHLTQLLNRNYFEQLLQQELNSIKHSRLTSAVLYIDLDNFKMINDEAGHAAGDQLLITIGEKVRSRLRRRDLAARLSGDEFAVLLHDVDKHSLEDLAQSFKDVLNNIRFSHKDQSFPVSGSIGVSQISVQEDDKRSILEKADYACKMAKQKGKNQVHIFSDHDLSGIRNAPTSGWRSRIKSALKNDLFKLMYQPIYNLSDIDLEKIGTVSDKERANWLRSQTIPAQFETFLRLENENGKIFMPSAFLNDAERFDLIAQIDCWVVLELLKQITKQKRETIINVNLSAHTLLDSKSSELIVDLFTQYPNASEFVQIELKEHHLFHYREQLIPILDALVDVGCHFQIDDFGRNFTLFSRVRELPIKGIKIDGIFTQNIAWDPVDRKLMHSMAEVARSSGIQTTIKSVESFEALINIEQGGIDFVQGHYLSYPQETF